MKATLRILMIVLIGFASLQALGQESEKEKDIRALLIETGSLKIGIQVASELFASYEQAFPNVPKEYWDRVIQMLNEEEFLSLIIPIYDKYYTHEEIRELIAFYKTPVGKKTIEILPALTQESMLVGQAWGTKISERIYQDLVEEGYAK